MWIGADEPIDTIGQIIAALANYGTIPEPILAKLRQDRVDRQPTSRSQGYAETEPYIGKKEAKI